MHLLGYSEQSPEGRKVNGENNSQVYLQINFLPRKFSWGSFRLFLGVLLLFLYQNKTLIRVNQNKKEIACSTRLLRWSSISLLFPGFVFAHVCITILFLISIVSGVSLWILEKHSRCRLQRERVENFLMGNWNKEKCTKIKWKKYMIQHKSSNNKSNLVKYIFCWLSAFHFPILHIK